MELKNRKHCPLCFSQNTKLFKKGTFDPEHIEAENFKITDNHYGLIWTFHSCRNCGFVFSNPYVTENGIVEFYSELVDREYSMEAEGRSKNFETILKRLKKIEKPGNLLLDIGAASGIFLNLAKKEGYDISGIEPSESLVEEAEKRYGIKLFRGTIKNFDPDKQFSVITLIDILEHLTEPEEFMVKIDTLIKKNGVLVIVTPDINSLASKLMGNLWWHYRVAHVNFFNLQSLQHLLTKHNYTIILKKRYAWNFSLFYILTRIFPFLKDKKTLQKILKSINLKLQLFDSWEIHAKKN